ncbi:hypothetical protein ACW2QC_14030 [Virgibacillus sp. FSP13]
MKNKAFHAYGSVQYQESCSTSQSYVKVQMHPFSSPKEREAILEKLRIGSQFFMRARGLSKFYGDDLIAYKRKKGSGKHANEFLRIFANYLTDNLEDNCPSSWKECQPSFWEELIFVHYPHHIKISIKQRESEIFLLQLKRFVRWLDHRAGTSWYELVEQYAQQASPELAMCERLLNHLYLRSYPNIHQSDWDFEKDITANESELNNCTQSIHSAFQVKEVFNEIITVTDIDSGRDYQIDEMPCNIIYPGMIVCGVIGKKGDDFYWTWYVTEGVYPARAKDYFLFVD